MTEFKLTSKYQHSKRLPNGTRRSILLYFLNDILIFKQKVPFDETAEYGYSKLAKNLAGKFQNVLSAFIVNYILFPYCLYIAIKTHKL